MLLAQPKQLGVTIILGNGPKGVLGVHSNRHVHPRQAELVDVPPPVLADRGQLDVQSRRL